MNWETKLSKKQVLLIFFWGLFSLGFDWAASGNIYLSIATSCSVLIISLVGMVVINKLL